MAAPTLRSPRVPSLKASPVVAQAQSSMRLPCKQAYANANSGHILPSDRCRLLEQTFRLIVRVKGLAIAVDILALT